MIRKNDNFNFGFLGDLQWSLHEIVPMPYATIFA